MSRYLANDVEANDDYLKLKVYSSKGDRLPTYRVVFGADANPRTKLLGTDLQLYLPGRNRVDEFQKYALKKLKSDYSEVPALWELAQGLLNCLKIVWIPLDQQKDDPQAIFESLNDKGMPLTASELLCNFLFRPIIDAKEDYEDLHNTQWLGAIRTLDDDERFEEYLRTLFSIGESKMVGRHRKVYVHFKNKNRQLSSMQAKQHLREISLGATLYRTIVDPQSHAYRDDAINELLIAISNTRMESSTPFVLAVLRALASERLGLPDTRRVLRETLVLLVRRKMTELSTTQYDAMFPPLLGKIINEVNKIAALQDQFKKHGVWVSDQEFQESLVRKPAYRSRDLAFSRMMLIELDKHYQSYGQYPDYTTVNTIEHMIPQTLDDAWKTYLGHDALDEHLYDVTHSVGNLCLLSAPANSAAGQDPFESKRINYSPVTALARQIKEYKGRWDLEAVRTRSRELARAAADIWDWTNVS